MFRAWAAVRCGCGALVGTGTGLVVAVAVDWRWIISDETESEEMASSWSSESEEEEWWSEDSSWSVSAVSRLLLVVGRWARDLGSVAVAMARAGG